MRGKVGGLSPPYFKSRGAIAPLAPLLPPPLVSPRSSQTEYVVDSMGKFKYSKAKLLFINFI